MSGIFFPNNNIIGLYSTTLRNPYYQGPVVRTVRQSDSTYIDFYSDLLGNLSYTSPIGTQSNYIPWINATSAKVSVWYDQSGNGNNLIQNTTSSQPYMSLNGIYFPGNGSNLTFTNPIQNCYTIATNTYTYSNAVPNSFQTILSSTYNSNIGYRFANSNIYGLAFTSTSNYTGDFLAPYNSYFYINNSKGYIGGTLQSDGRGSAVTGNSSGVYYDKNWNYIVSVRDRDVSKINMSYYVEPFSVLGSPTNSALNSYSLKGFISELMLLNTKIIDDDANTLYKTCLIPGSRVATVSAATTAVTNIGTSSLQVNWGAFGNYTSYVNVVWTPPASGGNTSNLTILTNSSGSYSVTGLSLNTTYTFTIIPYYSLNIPLPGLGISDIPGIALTGAAANSSVAYPSGTSVTTLSISVTNVGGTTTSAGPYTVVAFTTVGSTFSLTTTSSIVCDVLIVAGGGAGGSDRGGGGGAGGYLYFPNQTISTGTYSITVGSNGTGTTSGTVGGSGTQGNSGQNSSLQGFTASVGGGGGGGCVNSASRNGANGGSGGGGSQFNGAGSGGTPSTGQGNSGGIGFEAGSAGGGGGASASGTAATNGVGGNGGAGILNAISGNPYFYCSGGGGGVASGNTLGQGGIGAGNGSSTGNGNNATNYGCGGGGARDANTNVTGGNGYQGVVIVRYLTTQGTYALDSVTATPTLLFSTRRVRTGYTGPVIKLSTANTFTTPQDFYYINGALNTNSTGTGTSFTTWVGAGTAYVAIWYDQSGNGKNATGVSGSAAIYNNTLGLVDFTGTTIYMTLPSGTLPSTQVASSICFKNGIMAGTNTERGLLGTGTASANQWMGVGIIGIFNTTFISSYGTNAYGSSSGSGAYYGSITSIIAPSTGTSQNYSIYTNSGNTVSTTINNLAFTPSGNPDVLGSDKPATPTTNTFNGQLYWLSIYSSVLSTTDRTAVELQ